MTYYLLRRLLLMLLTILLTSALVFGLTQLLPGDMARLFLGRDASDAAIAEFNATFRLDDPPLQQYLRWIVGDLGSERENAAGGILRGDWGRSFGAGYPQVRPLISRALQYSTYLALMTLLISVPCSILLGILAGLKANSWLDNLISVLTLSVVGLPEFVTALALINIFALGLGWFDTTSMPNARDGFGEIVQKLMLPAVTATFVLLGYVTRMTRAGVQEELKKTYVRTATLKGLPRRVVVLKHVLAQCPAALHHRHRAQHRLADGRVSGDRAGIQLPRSREAHGRRRAIQELSCAASLRDDRDRLHRARQSGRGFAIRAAQSARASGITLTSAATRGRYILVRSPAPRAATSFANSAPKKKRICATASAALANW